MRLHTAQSHSSCKRPFVTFQMKLLLRHVEEDATKTDARHARLGLSRPPPPKATLHTYCSQPGRPPPGRAVFIRTGPWNQK